MNILSLTYLGNIRYYSKLCFSDYVIDIHEHYLKQSYRNRCDILAVNGPVPLVVNVIKGSNTDKPAVKDVRIDYSKRWQHTHWQALVSSYRNSPYFDYYRDTFEPFYRRKYDFLLDLNVELMQTVLKLMGNRAEMRFSDGYIDPCDLPADGSVTDLRDAISPKPRLNRPDPSFNPAPYWQVFSEKMPFVPNLSVIDLLFCEGPGSPDIISASIAGPEKK